MGQICFKDKNSNQRSKISQSKNRKKILQAKDTPKKPLKKIEILSDDGNNQQNPIPDKPPHKKTFRTIGTQTDEELLFSYIIEKRKKYEQMTAFFNQFNPPPPIKPKNTLLLDKLSMPNSSIQQIELSKNIKENGSHKDISAFLDSGFVKSNFKVEKNIERNLQKKFSSETNFKFREKNVVSDQEKDESEICENEMKSDSEHENDEVLRDSLRIEKKTEVVNSDKTRKKFLNRTTTLGVNDRFLKNKKLISISFDTKNKEEREKSKSKTPELRKDPRKVNKVSVFAEYIKSPVSPIIAAKKENFKKKLKKFSVIPKSREINELGEVDEILFDSQRKSENNKSDISRSNNQKSNFAAKSKQRKSQSKTPKLMIMKNSKIYKKSPTYGTPFQHKSNPINLLIPPSNPGMIIKSNVEKSMVEEENEGINRFFSYGAKSKKNDDDDQREIAKLFHSDQESELNSSLSSDIKDTKKFIMQDLEKSIMQGRSSYTNEKYHH